MKVNMDLDDEFSDQILIKKLQSYIRDKLNRPQPVHFEDTYHAVRAIDAANILLEHFGGKPERVKLPWEEEKEGRQTFWDQYNADTP